MVIPVADHTTALSGEEVECNEELGAAARTIDKLGERGLGEPSCQD
jgi:hypothetical protein